MNTPSAQQILREETIAPGGHFAIELSKGQVLRIIDVEGQQVADLVAFSRSMEARSSERIPASLDFFSLQ